MGPPPMGLPRGSGGPPMTSGRPLPPRLVAAQPVPFMGMQVDTPKANVQRRIYAADERVPEQAPAGPPGQYAPLPNCPTPTTQPSSPQLGAQGSNNNRIDPAQIPRQDAQADAGRPWLTRTNLGQVPPPATSGFLVEDDGNASPRYMRLSLNQLVASEDNLKASALPFGVVVQPLSQLVSSVVFRSAAAPRLGLLGQTHLASVAFTPGQSRLFHGFQHQAGRRVAAGGRRARGGLRKRGPDPVLSLPRLHQPFLLLPRRRSLLPVQPVWHGQPDPKRVLLRARPERLPSRPRRAP